MTDISPVGVPIPAISPRDDLPWVGWAVPEPGSSGWLGPLAPTLAAALRALAGELHQALAGTQDPPDDLDGEVAGQLLVWRSAPVAVQIHAADERTAWRTWCDLGQRPRDREALATWRARWPAPADGDDPLLEDVLAHKRPAQRVAR